jgi:hypothetical protein
MADADVSPIGSLQRAAWRGRGSAVGLAPPGERDELKALKGADMIFVTAGEGGGTRRRAISSPSWVASSRR